MTIANFVGDAVPRSLDGTIAALAIIGCDRATLESVIHVETGGHGFDKQGRPRALFEPHLFYRALTGPLRDRAVATGLAYPAWGTHPYPVDSYPRILAAMAIDEEAALRSASWGLGQILGSNCKAAGYPTAAAMVAAFVRGGEDEHLTGMAHFITANHLDADLRTHNWAAFAAGYNGPAYRRNNYDGLLKAAYDRAAAGLPKLPEHHLTPAVRNDAVSAPLSSSIGTLSSTVNGNTASITAEATARASADIALAGHLGGLKSAAIAPAAQPAATKSPGLFGRLALFFGRH